MIKMDQRLKGLEPVIDKRAKVLILGSFPSFMSLGGQQYYANPRNQFWNLMVDVLGWRSIPEEYAAKRRLLLREGVALWDVVESCHREGSLDGKIRDCCFNDIPGLLKDHPGIRAIFLNGRKAEKLFKATFSGLSAKVLYLPSSSPANARMPFSRKVKLWRRIKTR